MVLDKTTVSQEIGGTKKPQGNNGVADPGPRLTVERITPEVAERWLGKSARNRNLKRPTVIRYAADMSAGAWKLDGSTFKFDTQGRLLDGQHRLHAVIESGAEIDSFVARGLDQDAFITIDSGIGRSFADVLHLRGESSTTDLAAGLGLLWRWEHGQAHWVASGTADPRRFPTHEQLLRLLDSHPGIRDSLAVGQLVKRGIGLRRSLTTVCHYVFSRIDEDAPEDANKFFELLSSGAELPNDSPIYQLRELLLRDQRARAVKHGSFSLPYLWAVTIKSWNAYRLNEPVQALRWRQGGARPEGFPVPL